MKGRLLLATALLCMVLARSPASAENAWPTIPFPDNITTYPVDDIVSANGLPMKLIAFSSNQPREQLLAWFRKKIGDKVVENRLGDKIILGQARGEHYVTIQLETTRTGTRGIAAVSHLKTAYEQQAQTLASREHWLRQLPSGSRILSETSSPAGTQRSVQLIYTNTHSTSANSNALRSILSDMGLAFEREIHATESSGAPQNQRLADAKTIYFKGKNGEAMATVTYSKNRHTVVVLNTISTPGEPR